VGNEIERIESILEDACEELRKSANVLWPTLTDSSDIHESNLTLYIGHSFLNANYFAFVEVNLPEEEEHEEEDDDEEEKYKRLDLLAVDKNKKFLIGLQAKKFEQEGAVKMIRKEIKYSIKKYVKGLTEYPNYKDYKNAQKYGIYVISFWKIKNSDKKYLDWWNNMSENFKKPKKCPSDQYNKLTNLVLKELKNGAKKGSILITDNTKDGSEWYLLYLIFPLQ